jgi:hypothetical protein
MVEMIGKRAFWARARLVGAAAGIGAALIACNARKVQKPYCEIAGQQKDNFEQNITNKLDLIVLVDNSSSTRDKQVNMNCNFPRFISVLKDLPAGLPDLHLGVISSDMGSGAIAIPSCNTLGPGGDDGKFHATAKPQLLDCSMNGGTSFDTMGCTAPTDGVGWIRYKSATDNNVANQDLSKAFGCIAFLGDTGCGYEAQLLAIKRALERGADASDDPSNPNRKFLRSDALLAILLITDEDDCSVPADSLIGDTSGGTDISSPLGPLTSFRCTEFGVTCNGQKPPRAATPADLTNCVSNDTGAGTDERHKLLSVHQLAEDIKLLKPPGTTIIESISAPAPPDGRFGVRIGTSGGQMVPQLEHSCDGGTGVGAGDPAVRIQQFLQEFEAGKKVVPICQQSFAGALDAIAERIGARIGNQCVSKAPLDRDGKVTFDPTKADCSVSDVQDAGRPTECRVPLAQCGKGPTMAPACLQGAPANYTETCWYLEPNPVKMDGSPDCVDSKMALRVCRSGVGADGKCLMGQGEPPPNTTLGVKCASCTKSNGGMECDGDGLDNDCNGSIDQDDTAGAPHPLCDCT